MTLLRGSPADWRNSTSWPGLTPAKPAGSGFTLVGVVFSVEELLAGLGSAVVVLTVAVLSRVRRFGRRVSTWTTRVKTCGPLPAARVGRLAVTVPPRLPGAAVEVMVQPGGTATDFHRV